VALGRAIVRSPKVFLLDEPLSNLDAKLRGQTRVELQKLHRDLETTFIYVTHDQVEAMTMGDRIAIMNGGIFSRSVRRARSTTTGNLFVPASSAPDDELRTRRRKRQHAKASGFELKLPKAIRQARHARVPARGVTDKIVEGSARLRTAVEQLDRPANVT